MGSKIKFQPMPSASSAQFTCMWLMLFITTAVDVCKPFKGEMMQEWFNFERSITDYTDHFPRGWTRPLTLSLTFYFLPFFSALWHLCCLTLCQAAACSDVIPPCTFAMELYSYGGLWSYDKMNPKCLHCVDAWFSLSVSISWVRDSAAVVGWW